MEPGLGEANVAPLTRGTIRTGTSGWSYPSWVGPFYPPGTTPARMLPLYAQSFLTVEAHSTHRRTPTAAALARWAGQVPDGFRFAPKAHVGITHRRDTEGVGERIVAFFTALEPLGDRLGPVLFVLPHRRPDLPRLDLLLAGLHRLREPGAAVFELAAPWRTDVVIARLAGAGVSLAIVDRDDDPAEKQPEVGPLRYVRLRRSAYTDADLDAWAERLLGWAADGGRDVYAFLKHDEHGDGPRYAGDLVKRLERA